MTRERISNLSNGDLFKLAETFSMDVLDDLQLNEENTDQLSNLQRQELEEQIYEVLEEVRQEQRQGDAHPVQYHQKHFLSIEEFFGRKIEDESSYFQFPDQYNVTRIMLMLRDPEWAYTYWDISNQDRSRIVQRTDFRFFVIILAEIQDEYSTGPSGDTQLVEPVQMEIPVKLSDNNWYINLPRKHTSYMVELAAEYVENREVLASSGVIRVPGGSFSANLENISSRETEVLLAMSGIEDLGVSSYEGAPRKIVEVLESSGTDN